MVRLKTFDLQEEWNKKDYSNPFNSWKKKKKKQAYIHASAKTESPFLKSIKMNNFWKNYNWEVKMHKPSVLLLNKKNLNSTPSTRNPEIFQFLKQNFYSCTPISIRQIYQLKKKKKKRKLLS